MKKKLILAVAILMSITALFAACVKDTDHTQHIDENKDGVCDVCKEPMKTPDNQDDNNKDDDKDNGNGDNDNDDNKPAETPAEPKEYVFEAEWSPVIEDLSGFDYSGTLVGLNMITKDNYKKGASNGYYMAGLYNEGLQLEYTIVSDKKVEDATLVVRLSSEYIDITIGPSIYAIAVNGTDIAYRNITLDNVPQTGRVRLRDFEDFTLTTKLTLEEGENIITFTTNNTTPMVGTMYATAPLIDCFKITTTANLTWEPCKSNTNQE